MIPIAFYAPLKAPDHPVPSGDRNTARLFWAALRQAGFDPHLASSLGTREPTGDAARQIAIREAARGAADDLMIRFRGGATRPRLWFTYHSYYKAPDWLGPAVAGRLGIPYVLAEATRAGKRAGGPFDHAHRGAEAALAAADAIFVLTGNDREALARSGDLPLHDCPPFVDAAAWACARSERRPGPVRLLAVAMMREGDKLRSFRVLAEALSRLAARDWELKVVGDGPASAAVRSMFEAFGPRVTFAGAAQNPEQVRACYGSADLLVWPAVNEAFGMVLLEAQAAGCPVLAGRHGGVADTLRDGVTGRLCAPGPDAFATALAEMLDDLPGLARMGRAAAGFIRDERDVASAARRLRRVLKPLLRREAA